MDRFEGSLRLHEEIGPGLRVVVNLDRERLSIHTPGGDHIGEWPLSQIGIRAEDDGFHLRLEGEECVVSLEDEPAFARKLGLRAASPRMARRITAAVNSGLG